MLADAASPCPQYPKRVRLVDHQEDFVALAQLDETRQVGEIPVHAVDTFEDHHHALVVAAMTLQQVVEHLPVIVPKGDSAGAGEQGAHLDAVVDQFVVEDQILRTEEMRDRRDVGPVPADKGQAGLGIEKLGECAFEFDMNGSFATDDAARRHRRAVTIERLSDRRLQSRMARQPQVIVVGEADVLALADPGGVSHEALVKAEIGNPADFGRLEFSHTRQQVQISRMEIEAVMRFGNRGVLEGGRVRHRFERRTGDTLAHHTIGQLALLVRGRIFEQCCCSFGQRARSFARSRSSSKSRPSAAANSGSVDGSSWSGSGTCRAASGVGVITGAVRTWSTMRCASFATVVVSISSSVDMTIPHCFSNFICSSTSISESMPRSSSDWPAASFAGAIPTIPATCLISSCSAKEIASARGSSSRCPRTSSKSPSVASFAALSKASRTRANFGALATTGRIASRDQLSSARVICDTPERIACSIRSSASAGASSFTPSRSPSIRATTGFLAYSRPKIPNTNSPRRSYLVPRCRTGSSPTST